MRVGKFLATLILLCSLSAFGCDFPRDSTEPVRAEFLKKHPTYTVEEIGQDVSEEWGEYFNVWYRKPDDPNRYFVIVGWKDGKLVEGQEMKSGVGVNPK